MKKYLSLAAVLGAIAFLSVSYVAQAQQPAAAPAAGNAMQAAPAAAGTANFAKDRAECDALASAPTTEGAAPSEADKAASIKKCLLGKGHSEEEVTKEEAAKSPAAPATAPAAPVTK